MTATNGKHPIETDILLEDGDVDLEYLPMTQPKPRHQLPNWLKTALIGSGQFSASRALLLLLIGWFLVTQVPGMVMGTLRKAEAKQQTNAAPLSQNDILRKDGTYKGVMFRVSERFVETSNLTRNDTTQALAQIYIDHANKDAAPYAYLVRQMNDRLYDLNQIKGSKLLWSGTDLEQSAKYQLHIDALALAMNVVAQGKQSSLDSTLDLIPLSKAGDVQMGVFQQQVIPALTDPPPPKPERGFKIPAWMDQPFKPTAPQETKE
jgi:hypothetical protein